MLQKGIIDELVDRNFGYIRRIGIEDTLFFHADALNGLTFKELKKGDAVTFDVTESKKGPYAVNVSRA
jgi:CspA family cold shock protein